MRWTTYWRLKSNVDSGNFDAVQLAGAAALSPDGGRGGRVHERALPRRRDLVCDALRAVGVEVTPPRATIYVWAPVPEGFDSSAAYCEHVLERGRRRGLARAARTAPAARASSASR